jgi:hypothetical protein
VAPHPPEPYAVTLPRLFTHWKPVLGTIAAFYVGKSGWVAIGPGDQIDDLRSEQVVQANLIAVQAGQISDVVRKIDFVTELLCDGILTDSVRSRGDRYLRQQCQSLVNKAASSQGAGG